MALPDDPEPASAIQHPEGERVNAAKEHLFFPSSCSESFPGSR